MILIHSLGMYGYYGGIVGCGLFIGYFIAHRNQAIQVAASSLPPPSRPIPKAGAKPLGVRDYIAMAAIVFFVFAVLNFPAVFINFIQPHIKSQLTMDIITSVFGVIVWFFACSFVWEVLAGGVAWDWNNGKPQLAVTHLSTQPSDWPIAQTSAAVTAVYFGTQYFGLEALGSLMACPMMLLYGVHAMRYSVKRIYRFIILAPLIVGSVFLGVWLIHILWIHFNPDSSDTPKPAPEHEGKLIPSPWIVVIYHPIWMSLPFGLIFAFLSAAIRCDASIYGSTPPAPLEVIHVAGRPVAPIGKLQNNPRKPLFMAGMVTLALTAALAPIVMQLFLPEEYQNLAMLEMGPAAAMITVPCGIAFWARCTGIWHEWYTYDEISPDLSSTLRSGERQAIDDVENLLEE